MNLKDSCEMIRHLNDEAINYRVPYAVMAFWFLQSKGVTMENFFRSAIALQVSNFQEFRYAGDNEAKFVERMM